MQLSKSYSLKQLTKSAIAEKHKIANEPPKSAIPLAKQLCNDLLEPIVAEFGEQTITSGFRCFELGFLVNPKTAATSDHGWDENGCAVDFYPKKGNIQEVYLWIVSASSLPFDQCILEYDKATKKPRCIHISLRAQGSRGQKLIGSTYGKGSYTVWTPETELA